MTSDTDIIWTVGTRKSSTARVRMMPGDGKIIVNNKTLDEYFGGLHRQLHSVLKPFRATDLTNKYDVIADLYGGGITGQADALCLAIARALARTDHTIRRTLHKASLLSRDPRMVERKKSGQPKARKRFQYSKR
ncbi:MAG: 30S ribosomal protein S9 [Elusimicrobia bacterium]|nr:30S ribosomal protein S9 [Elusimicrobiota bacterium]MBD3411709.1 30S ribosomal protein S9 [Elusimicrobiota bacterium]